MQMYVQHFYVDRRMCFIPDGTLCCATPVVEKHAGAFCHVTATSQRFKICIFCLKYSEYLVHGLRVIIKILFYLKRLCFVFFLAPGFLAQLTENISANTKCHSDVIVIIFCGFL